MEYRENFGEFRPDTTMKILSSVIASNNRVALKALLKMVFTMVLKSMEQSLTTFLDKGFHQKIGLKILPPYLMNLKLGFFAQPLKKV